MSYCSYNKICKESGIPCEQCKPKVELKCPKCNVVHKVIEICDNDCGTETCIKYGVEYYLDKNNKIKEGHNPRCGKD